jgi:hypothetical protein
MPYITTDASDYYHRNVQCEAFQAGRRGSEAAGYRSHDVRKVTAEQAEQESKTPCTTCLTE